MTITKEINQFKAHFSKKTTFTVDDIRSYYQTWEPELNDSTLRWRIYNLKNKNIINTIGHGSYTLQSKPQWVPSIDNSIISIYKKIDRNYNKLSFTIWSTAWLHEFTNLQTFHHMVVIPVERNFTESVFEFLKEKGQKNLYLLPDKKEVNYYLSDAKETYIIKTLITKSPLFLFEKIKIPKLEKILVDLFCDIDLFNAFQGSELINIFQKAFSTYAINKSVLFSYARRRAREAELFLFIKDNNL